MPAMQQDWFEVAAPGGMLRLRRAVHPRARRLRLSVDINGARLTWPPGTQPAQAQAFVRQHAAWLRQKLSELHLDAIAPTLRVGHPDQLHLRGESLHLRWREGRFPALTHAPGNVQLQLPAHSARPLALAHGLLRGFLESELRRDASRALHALVPHLGLAPSALQVRPLKSLWGSLDTRDRITLDLSLVLAPPAVARYVVAHELAHLRVRNHSARFWAQVQVLDRDFAQQREWLREHGAHLKLELIRLIGTPARG